jgi:hypothetical protein
MNYTRVGIFVKIGQSPSCSKGNLQPCIPVKRSLILVNTLNINKWGIEQETSFYLLISGKIKSLARQLNEYYQMRGSLSSGGIQDKIQNAHGATKNRKK